MSNIIPTEVLKRSNKSSISRSGFTMMEIVIVLLMISISLAAIWAAANSVMKKRTLNQGIMEIWQIAENIRTLYTGLSLSSSPSVVTLVCSGAFPREMLRNNLAPTCPGQPLIGQNQRPFNAWGGQVIATVTTTKTFSIEFQGLTKESCIQLASYIRATGLIAPIRGQEGKPTRSEVLNSPVNIFVDVTGQAPTGIAAALPHECTAVRFTFDL